MQGRGPKKRKIPVVQGRLTFILQTRSNDRGRRRNQCEKKEKASRRGKDRGRAPPSLKIVVKRSRGVSFRRGFEGEKG